MGHCPARRSSVFQTTMKTAISLPALLGRRPRWCVAGLVLAALCPFLGKPLHIDDPLFVWMARHLIEHPLDPYGFAVNWYGMEMPMAAVMQNPPGAACFLALAGALMGWSETGLHLAMLLPAVGAALGVFEIARRICDRPLLAVAATVWTPAFLVSGTALMSDMLLLCWWSWAVAFWLRGLEERRQWWFLAASLMICLAAMTKYFGACLVPLLGLHALLKDRKHLAVLPWLALPLVLLFLFEGITRAKYGRGLVSDAMGFASGALAETRMSAGARTVVALAFAGGALAWPTLLFAVRRGLIVFLMAFVLCAGGAWWFVFREASCAVLYPRLDGPSWWLSAQAGVWVTGAAGLLAAGWPGKVGRPDPVRWLLFCWIVGTFVFAGYINWMINVRYLLPMVPAVAILAVRELDRAFEGGCSARRFALMLIPSGMLAVGLGWSDLSQASAVRLTARDALQTGAARDGGLWFEGHWGFQYYMEQGGAQALDRHQARFDRRDLLAIPSNNTNTRLPPPAVAAQRVSHDRQPSGWLTVFHAASAAGFYSSAMGPLPFAFGPPPAESVTLFEFLIGAHEL